MQSTPRSAMTPKALRFFGTRLHNVRLKKVFVVLLVNATRRVKAQRAKHSVSFHCRKRITYYHFI